MKRSLPPAVAGLLLAAATPVGAQLDARSIATACGAAVRAGMHCGLASTETHSLARRCLDRVWGMVPPEEAERLADAFAAAGDRAAADLREESSSRACAAVQQEIRSLKERLR